MTKISFDMVVQNNMGVGITGALWRNEDLEMGRVPCIAMHAFCDTPETASAIEIAATDRRMSRATVNVMAGGIPAAVRFYQKTPTPDLIVIESKEPPDRLLQQLDALAAVCDASSKIVVIGASNDIRLYRELVNRDVSEYILAPVEPLSVIATVSRIYRSTNATQLGKVYAFVGAKGGVGSSTVAHNIAWSIGQRFDTAVLLIDMDLAFGTVGLNFDCDPTKGIADVVGNPDRLDEAMFERLLTKCGNHLNLLTAPLALDKSYDFDEGAFEQMLDIARSNFPYVVLDVPHLWTAWAKKTLFMADELVITAMPDLPNLTGAKHLVDTFKLLRPLDAAPKVVLNQVGVAKRPEIKPKKFAEALQLEPIMSIASDPKLFGQAENVGKIVCESSAKSKAAKGFSELAQKITGRKELKPARSGGLSSLFGRAGSGQREKEKQDGPRDAA